MLMVHNSLTLGVCYSVYETLCNIVVLVIRVCEDTPLKVLLKKYLHPTDSDPVVRHRLVSK